VTLVSVFAAMKQSTPLSHQSCLSCRARARTKVLGHDPITQASQMYASISPQRAVSRWSDPGVPRHWETAPQGAGYKSSETVHRESSRGHRRSRCVIWIATQVSMTTATHPRTSLSCQTRPDTPQSKYRAAEATRWGGLQSIANQLQRAAISEGRVEKSVLDGTQPAHSAAAYFYPLRHHKRSR
jgi:hypothetical protein